MLGFFWCWFFPPVWLLFTPVYFIAYYFFQVPCYSSQPADFSTQNSFLHNNKKINPPPFQSRLILISSKLTTFSSNRNRSSSAICPELKCSFPKLPDEDTTLSWKRGWGCRIRQFNTSAFSVAFWIHHCRSGTLLQHTSKTHRSPALISLVLPGYWFKSTQVYEATPTKNWDKLENQVYIYFIFAKPNLFSDSVQSI